MDRANFTRFSPESFEDLVRALAFASLGTRGTVYSRGPDGGRDFSFEGPVVAYQEQGWDGVLVLQVKYRCSSGQDDASWLIKQLKEERAKFTLGRAALKLPDYYIIASNVQLSGADGLTSTGKVKKGGDTRVREELDLWIKQLGIKGYDIWPADKINLLLTQFPEIRKSFAAWVTPSDVLAEVLEAHALRKTSFERVIRRAIINSLRRHQYAELKDAGSVSDTKIRTSQVFVDVPVKPFPDMRSKDGLEANVGVVSALVARSKERLFHAGTRIGARQAGSHLVSNRIVLLGGPGQGKSTISGFVTQLFRAVLIATDETASFDDVMTGLVPEILSRAQGEGISTSLPPRYPVFVSLPRFADAISESKRQRVRPPTLLRFVAEDLSDGSDEEVTRDELRAWLGIYPWVVVLDGLDEVPPSGERDAVLNAISELMTEIGQVQGDALVVVTTRPQGYNEDLDRTRWEHWELADLPTERALAYAQALGEARYPDDRRRRQNILANLESAASEPATSRLMVSPLQVTILYLIVDTGGSAPTARWSLFHEYFEVLKKREKAKGGALQRILERNSPHLGPIHQRAGLLLQAMSELEGGATAALTRALFEKLVENYLASLGYRDSDLRLRASELSDVALNRLVLLAAREEGKIRFDVRSLQEFMAASALTAAESDLVERRLLHIASASHWRHVFLIAASRCFAEDAFHHRRLTVVSLARALDVKQDSAAHSGARLAYEMFVDGIGIDHPISRRLLVGHALELLGIGSGAAEADLSRLWEEGTSDLVLDVLGLNLKTSSGPTEEASWSLAIKLADQSGVVEELAYESWPERERALDLLPALDGFPRSPKLLKRIRETLRSATFPRAWSIADRHDASSNEPKWRQLLFSGFGGPLVQTYASLLNKGLSVATIPIDNGMYFELLCSIRSDIEPFRPLQIICSFGIKPSGETLAAAITEISKDVPPPDWPVLARFVPWPLATLLDYARTPDELSQFAARGKEGAFGDQSAWAQAEARWREQGISESDLLAASDCHPFGTDVAKIGAPRLRWSAVGHAKEAVDTVRRLARLIPAVPSTRQKEELAYLASIGSLGGGRKLRLSSIDDSQLFLESQTLWNPRVVYASAFGILASKAWKDSKCVEMISSLASRGVLDPGDTDGLDVRVIAEALNRSPNARGLIHLLLFALILDPTSRPRVDDPSQIKPQPTDAPSIQMSAGLLANVYQWDWAPSAAQVAGKILDWGRATKDGWEFTELLDELFSSNLVDGQFKRDCLLELDKMMEAEVGAPATRVRILLKAALDARKSDILTPRIWTEALHLPADALRALVDS